MRIVGKRSSYKGIEDKDVYDPNAFYVRAADKNGHSSNPRVRYDPDVITHINRIIASGALAGTPIKTLGDACRDALVHWLHKAGELTQDPLIQEAAENQRRLAVGETLVRELEEQQKYVTDVRESLDASMRALDVISVEKLLAIYEGAVIDKREPYRSKIEESLQSARRWLKSQAKR